MRLCLATLLLLSGTAAAQFHTTDAGLVGLTLDPDGLLGTGFLSPAAPSCRYPMGSPVEHLFLGGLWIGGVASDGSHRVSTVAVSPSHYAQAQEANEFANDGTPLTETSNLQNSDLYHPDALATQHLETRLRDDLLFGPDGHAPLGLQVTWRALAWSAAPVDDAVVLQALITPVAEAVDSLCVGLWMDTTVGDTEFTSPWGGPSPWNYYDDRNGALRPADGVDAVLMYEHDGDGDGGLAPSWIGTQWLGASTAPLPGAPPASYNQHRYRAEPAADDWYVPSGETEAVPGRYQLLANGDWDVGATAEADFSTLHNWNGLLSAGPFPALAAGDTLTVTFAVVCGADSTALVANAETLQQFFDDGFEVVVANEDPAPGTVPAAAPGLLAAAPNPFNPRTAIAWMAAGGPARLTVHDLRGRTVAVLHDGAVPAGPRRTLWDGRADAGADLPAGSYLLRLRQGGAASRLRVTLVR